MRKSLALGAVLLCTSSALAACYNSTSNSAPPPPVGPTSPPPSSTPTPTPIPTGPTPTPTPIPTGPTPTPTGSAQPQVVHIGFNLKEHTDPKYGPVWFFSPVAGNQANIVQVVHGSQLVFVNDSNPPSGPQHTASGLGSSGFPLAFDNTSGFTQNGTTIDSGLTWSTGILNTNQMSQVFTVGAPGVYYFGCAFHYTTVPTKKNQSMGDVIVSM